MNDLLITMYRSEKRNSALYIPIDLLKEMVRGLSGNEFKVYCAISSLTNESGVCSPTQEALVKITGLTINTVNKTVNSLLLVTIGNIPILTREIKGKGSARYSIYKIPVNVTEIKEYETSTEHILTASDVMRLFKQKYSNQYGLDYNPSYKREMSMIKNKLLSIYSEEQIKIIIDITIEDYDKRWRKPEYPRPTIGAICSWLANQALAVHADRQKNSRSKWDDMEVSDEAYNL